MKKTRIWMLAALAVASFSLVTGQAQAKPGGGHGHGPGQHPGAFIDKKIDKALDEIEVTPEQRQQIEAVRDRVKQQAAQERESMGNLREQRRQGMQQFWTDENPDVQKLRSVIDERLERQRTRAYAVADATVEIHRILTPEQRAELAQLIEEAPRRMDRKHKDHRRGKKHGDPRPEQQQRGR